MKLTNLPLSDWQNREAANKVVHKIDQKAAYRAQRQAKDGVIEDSYYSTGLGRGFYCETHAGKFRVELDSATGKPKFFTERHEHTEGGYKDETLTMQVGADGGKTYSRKLYTDYGGQIFSQTETVKTAPDGTTTDYQVKPDSKVDFTNWIRRNRSVETLAALSVGGTLGALAGNFLFGGYGAIMGGFLGANVGNAIVAEDQKVNHRSDPSKLENAIWRPVDQLRTGVQIGGAITGVGLIFALSMAIAG
jgi:hypothetical protein